MAGPENHPGPAEDASIDEISDDIAHTRQEVSETVAALTDKLDVKGRVSDAATQARHDVVDAVTDERGSVKPALPAAAAVVLTAATLLGVILWRRRRQGGPR